MTAEQIVTAALSECEVLGWKHFQGSRIPLVHRISVRQQRLFSLAAQWNPDYAGWSMLGQLLNGVADLTAVLRDDHPDLPGAERIERVEITDSGSSTYAAGEQVHIVRATDAAAHLPPRATLRSGWLEQVGGDLAGVAQVRVHYIRRPRPIEEPTDEPEIQGAHVDLLVLDLAKHLLTSSGDAEAAAPLTRALAGVEAREKEALLAFEAHVRGFTRVEDRFA